MHRGGQDGLKLTKEAATARESEGHAAKLAN